MYKSATDQLTTYKYTPALIVKGNEKEQVPELKHPFLIPIYQRLYTWETEHVERLLHDLFEAYRPEKSKATEEYFIGAIVISVEHLNDARNYELIDGQQRLTTLWLIASVLVKNKALSNVNDWRQFLVLDDKPRLNFSGRDADIKALSSFVSNLTTDKYGADDHSWLKNEAMINARKTISRFFNSDEFNTECELQGFSHYLWSNASFVITQLHPHADKERFFDTMNSRGVQLENHEILKALMLSGLDNKELQSYGRAWDLCADIDGYIPGRFQSIFNYGLSPIDENQIVSVLHDGLQDKVDNEQDDEVTLETILKPDFLKKKVESNVSDNPRRYKSPVSFPTFLLHVLQIYVENQVCKNNTIELGKSISLDDKKLIDTFKLLSKANCHLRIQFIECLLECRLLLDNFVIKGLLEGEHEQANWQITSRLANEQRDSRIKFTGRIWDSIHMLQSMMHFSPMNGVQRAKWLTQTLRDLRRNAPTKKAPENFLLNLRKQHREYENSLLGKVSLEGVLLYSNNNKLGTSVHRYWFYKLDYCLWELWFNNHSLTKSLCPKPDILNVVVAYRMRAVNSIEHVSPQSKKSGKISPELLDNFGNLALISVSENSSYSDKDPIEKKSSFSVSYSKNLIQSLKLAHIFSVMGNDVTGWNDSAMARHGLLMVKILKAFQSE